MNAPSGDPPARSLSLSASTMRELGYRMVDQIVDHLTSLPELPAIRFTSRAALEETLRSPLPARPSDPHAAIEQLRDGVLGWMSHTNHPRFFAFVPSPANYVAALADFAAAAYNVFAGSWIEAAGASAVERVTADWLGEACGLPPTRGGVFLSGGSMANVCALAVVRRKNPEGRVVYFSGQAHSSIARGLRLLGHPESATRIVSCGADHRMIPEALAEAMSTDLRRGDKPLAVIATAGTTNTGAIDPIEEISAAAKRWGAWLHVDGAYGAGAALGARGRQLLGGLRHADSISLDPHKWLFQPYACGCLLVRDAGDLRDTFATHAEYLKDAELGEEEFNYWDYSPELTRPARALKLWLTIQVFGAEAMGEAIDHGFAMAEAAEAEVRKRPGWEVVSPAQMAILAFRYAPAGTSGAEADARNAAIAQAMIRDGFAAVLTTKLHGRTVLRMCTIHPRLTVADIVETIERLDRMAKQAV